MDHYSSLSWIRVLGGFGDSRGILNTTRKNIGIALIEYDRFLRVEKKFILKIDILQENTNNITVTFNGDYINKVKISDVIPEPEEVEIINNKLVYKFNSTDTGTITFFNDPLKMGAQTLHLEVNESKVVIPQYIYF